MKFNKKHPFRAWFYFRMGWGTYFAFIFAAINTLVVTYYLAIEKIPALEIIFPSFVNYVIIISLIGIPILVIFGYAHFKRTHAFGTEQEISVESNPYNYRLVPGHQIQVFAPAFLELLKLNLKIINKEPISEGESKKINEIIEKLSTLCEGGWVGKPQHVS